MADQSNGSIDAFLRDLSRALSRRGWAMLDDSAEMEDHLLSAAEEEEARGMPRAAAEARAVERFGNAERIVAAFDRELASVRSGIALCRRVSELFCAVTIVTTAWFVVANIRERSGWGEQFHAAYWIPILALIVALVGTSLMGLMMLRTSKGSLRQLGRSILLPISVGTILLLAPLPLLQFSWWQATESTRFVGVGRGFYLLEVLSMLLFLAPIAQSIALLSYLVASRRLRIAGLSLLPD